MRTARAAAAAALGFFALAAQALLFREFLTAFEGNELAVGAFFASWLLWVGLGAILGRGDLAPHRLIVRHFTWAPLLYLPAFLLQQWLLCHLRPLAGVAPYEIFPLRQMLYWSGLVNAPVSLVSGALFTLACRASGDLLAPISRVFSLETLGAALGGTVVSWALSRGFSAETVLLMAAFILGIPPLLSALAGRPAAGWLRPLGFIPAALPALALLLSLAGPWSEWQQRQTWSRLLPAASYRGHFATPQAVYQYGESRGQWVVTASGGTVETYPEKEHSSEVLALTLAQQPAARRILLLGPSSLALAARYLELPQLEQVVWLPPDAGYPPELLSRLPEEARLKDRRFLAPGQEVRRYLAGQRSAFDLIVLHLPETSSLAQNRYQSEEFFNLLAGALSQGGCLAMKIPGGANYLGPEAGLLGASALATVLAVFPETIIKPGEESWILASSAKIFSRAPAQLRDRFAAIPGASRLYEPQGLMVLYQPQRVEQAEGNYRRLLAELSPSLLQNRDSQPRALLYGLLLALKRSGVGGLATHLTAVVGAVFWGPLLAAAIYTLLRLLYLWRARFGGKPGENSLFDGRLLVFGCGSAAMSASLILLFQYQAHYGSLFLHLGLLSALFMLGASLGSFLGERGLARMAGLGDQSLPVAVLLQLAALGGLAMLPVGAALWQYGLALAGCGAVFAAIFPAAAEQCRRQGDEPAASAARLELLDHWGAALGAALTGLVFLPCLGKGSTLQLLAALLSAALATSLLPLLLKPRTAPSDPWERRGRVLAYWAAGIAAAVILTSNIFVQRQAAAAKGNFSRLARELSGRQLLQERRARLPGGETLVYYFAAGREAEPDLYLFDSQKLAPDIYGYGGKLRLAMAVTTSGELADYQFIDSRETPAYQEMLTPWKERLKGRNLFGPQAFRGIDALSGASITANGVLAALDLAGRNFAAAVLGRGQAEPPPAAAPRPDRNFLLLSALTLAALFGVFFPGRWRRRGLLVAAVATGLWLNLQYSLQQLLALLSFQLPPPALGAPLFLTLIAPLLALLFGNLYCGQLCPFGAAQELVGEWRPASTSRDPAKEPWRLTRAVKYWLLFFIVLLFAFSREASLAAADPLLTFFSGQARGIALTLGAGSLLLAVFFRRFWCRNLCPAGAFLALLGALAPAKKWLPPVKPGRCDLGVRSEDDLDCLRCYRCRDEKK